MGYVIGYTKNGLRYFLGRHGESRFYSHAHHFETKEEAERFAFELVSRAPGVFVGELEVLKDPPKWWTEPC